MRNRIVQLSMVTRNPDGTECASLDLYADSERVPISYWASRIHGIDDHKLLMEKRNGNVVSQAELASRK